MMKSPKPVTFTKKIPVDMYSCTVAFVITDNLKAYVDGLKKIVTEIENMEDLKNSEGFTISSGSTVYMVVYDANLLSHNLISHEIFHAVIRMTTDRDIEDEESQAWLCGYLTEQFYKFYQTKKVTEYFDKRKKK